MKLTLVKHEGKLIPAYSTDREVVEKIGDGEIILVEYRKTRNPKHHRLIFALARCTLENMPGLWGDLYVKNPNGTAYLFIKAVMREIGKVKIVPNIDGTLRTETLSMNFENMSEEEFQPVSDAVFEVCAQQLKIPVNDLRKNYLEWL